MNTPVRSVKNQYRGINAHLHSIWQAGGGWSSFHTSYIDDLLRTMRPLLIPMGYDAELEPSLQVRRLDDSTSATQPESDVSIYDRLRRGTAAPHPYPEGVGMATRVLPIPEALYGNPLSEKRFQALGLYTYIPDHPERALPVAWIELLSPSNKPSGRDAKTYFNKRLKLLDSGLVFVEIDYLHETAPTLRGIPVYRARHGQKRDAEARAYRIIVFDPRPQMQQGMTQVYEFDVDTPLPIVNIPLNAGDQLVFDFAVPYRKTYEETLHGFQRVDYAQLPPNFERYDRDDQTRIVNRMLTVLRAASDGRDLEAAPLPQADLLPLDAALDQIKALVSASAS